MSDPTRIKASLPRTWSVFFARHGNFTAVQQQAIPVLLAGRNAMVIAATASGKTEAVIVPLLERHVLGQLSGTEQAVGLTILYICPTRALVRDLYERLQPPLHKLGVSLAMKSGDTGPVSTSRPPTVLITTPESTDSLLTRAPRLLSTLKAIVLDEIHLFDDSPRGDHIRCLLNRIEYVRRYRQQEAELDRLTPLQRVALSATVPDPISVAERYLTSEYEIIQAEGGRRIEAEIRKMAGLRDLVSALTLRASSGTGIRKSLIFCNTRNQVEQTAAFLRQNLPYAASIYVHYSNIDPAMRRQVEDDFAEAGVAICVSSSTLELGVDIGSIDDIILLGPPPNVTSFLQRIGRGGRRTDTTKVLCLARSNLEQIRFQALLDVTDSSGHPVLTPPTYHFRPSVLIQQIFSVLKQSPTGAIRLADLRNLAPVAIDDDILTRILNYLTVTGYLRSGRLGEWRPDEGLNDLLDAHEIYSNIGTDPFRLTIIDAYSGRTIAQTNRIQLEGDTLLMGGRAMEVVWRDRYKIAVRRSKMDNDEPLRFYTEPLALPFEVGQAVAAHLRLEPGQICLICGEDDTLLFHFWGDLYGALLAGMLKANIKTDDGVEILRLNEHCLELSAPLHGLPPWDATLLRRQLRVLYPQLQSYLDLGRFHSLLPPDVAYDAVIDQCDLPRFERLYRNARLITPPVGLRKRLLSLI